MFTKHVQILQARIAKAEEEQLDILDKMAELPEGHTVLRRLESLFVRAFNTQQYLERELSMY